MILSTQSSQVQCLTLLHVMFIFFIGAFNFLLVSVLPLPFISLSSLFSFSVIYYSSFFSFTPFIFTFAFFSLQLLSPFFVMLSSLLQHCTLLCFFHFVPPASPLPLLSRHSHICCKIDWLYRLSEICCFLFLSNASRTHAPTFLLYFFATFFSTYWWRPLFFLTKDETWKNKLWKLYVGNCNTQLKLVW